MNNLLDYINDNEPVYDFDENDLNTNILSDIFFTISDIKPISKSQIILYGTFENLEKYNRNNAQDLKDLIKCGSKTLDVLLFQTINNHEGFRYEKQIADDSLNVDTMIRTELRIFHSALILYLITSRSKLDDNTRLPKFISNLLSKDEIDNFNKYVSNLSSINLDNLFSLYIKLLVTTVKFEQRVANRLNLGIAGHRHVKALIKYKNQLKGRSTIINSFIDNYGNLDKHKNYLLLHHGAKNEEIIKAGSISDLIDHIFFTTKNKTIQNSAKFNKDLYEIKNKLTIDEAESIAKNFNKLFDTIKSSEFEFKILKSDKRFKSSEEGNE